MLESEGAVTETDMDQDQGTTINISGASGGISGGSSSGGGTMMDQENMSSSSSSSPSSSSSSSSSVDDDDDYEEPGWWQGGGQVEVECENRTKLMAERLKKTRDALATYEPLHIFERERPVSEGWGGLQQFMPGNPQLYHTASHT